MKERVKLRIDGCIVDATLVEQPVGRDDDGLRIRHWSVIFDTPIEFEEHSMPKVEAQKHGVWMESRWGGIPKKGGSTIGFISFPEPV